MKHLTLVTVFLLSACANLGQKDTFFITSVNSSGTDSNTQEFCSDFRLSLVQAQAYFDQAQLISVDQLHNDYSYLPCYVQGTGHMNEQSCRWEIRAGGTAKIFCGEEVLLYGCSECGETFK